MAIDMQLLKQLRDTTLAPMKDCKDALVEANGDLVQAQGILRKKGMSKAGKKADRETKEGLVKIEKVGDKLIALKLLCETDFVAKNEEFIQLMDNIMEKLSSLDYAVASKDELKDDTKDWIEDAIKEFIGKLGENTKLGDVVISMDNAYIYNHSGNKVASIVYYEGDSEDVAKEIALQVAAMNPSYLDFDSVPGDIIENMTVEFREELLKSGKPENMIDQILKGKINKALAEDVLLEQPYIRDGAKKIKDIIPESFKVKSYVRLAIG